MSYLVVDASAFVHSKMNSLIAYSKRRSDEIDLRTMTSHALGTALEVLRKATKVDLAHIVFAFDCRRANIWRHDHIDGYKANRSKGGSFDMDMYIAWIDGLKETFKPVAACHPKLEADDLAWLLADRLSKTGATVYVATSDRDFCQMESTLIKVINVKDGTPLVAAPNITTHKALYGDSSDNIKGAASKKLTPEEVDQVAAGIFTSEAVDWKKFKQNMLVIDFKNIPSALVEEAMPNVDGVVARVVNRAPWKCKCVSVF